jgi:hypothetical protein
MLSHPLTKTLEKRRLLRRLRGRLRDDTDIPEMPQKHSGAVTIILGPALKTGASTSRNMPFEPTTVTGVEVGQWSSATLQPEAEMRRRPHVLLDRLCAIASLRQHSDEIVEK